MKNSLGRLAIVSWVILASACGSGDSSSGSAATAVVGEDFSGSYRFAWVECYDSSFELSALAVVNDSSAVSTLVINGNSTQSTSTTGSCTVKMTGAVQFNQDSSSSGVSSGTADMVTSSISVTGASSCTLNTYLTPVTGSPNLTPSSLSSTWTNASSGSSNSASYIRDSDGFIYLTSVFQVEGSPSDICLMVYDRL